MEPVHPVACLVVVAAVHQSQQREGCVAQPAISVVPVAHTSDIFRKRGGGRSDNASCWAEGECLERDHGTRHQLAVLPLVGALSGPLCPEVAGLPVGFLNVHGIPNRVFSIAAVGSIGKHKRDRLALADDEVTYGAQVLSYQRSGGVQLDCIRSGDGPQACLRARHPWDCLTVAETEDEFSVHFYLAVQPLHDAHYVRVCLPRRHKVGDLHGSALRLTDGL
jgi:hypothetical protein